MGHPAPSALKSGNNGAVGMSARFSKIGAFVLGAPWLVYPAARRPPSKRGPRPRPNRWVPISPRFRHNHQVPRSAVRRMNLVACPRWLNCGDSASTIRLRYFPIGPGDVIDISFPGYRGTSTPEGSSVGSGPFNSHLSDWLKRRGWAKMNSTMLWFKSSKYI